jgi:23S rRNA (cytidine1920-2'-O)/16S rRNA (cytidine1409-2'-O)-methyltransferase
VRRGLADSREQAQEAVRAGRVLVSGAAADKPARLVSPSEAVIVMGPPPRYVSRGGEKLAGALARFDVSVEGKRALDAGSSTGGFTDCLLQHGAVSVVAVDVGRAQLHERLLGDPRVRRLEETNIRHVSLATLGEEAFPIVVADLSFISLRRVAEALLGLADSAGDLILLVKPQFEAGRAEVSRGRGVIRDPRVWESELTGVLNTYLEHGATIMGVMISPLRGADGNVEFLAHLRRGSPQPPPQASGATTPVEAMAAAVVAEARADLVAPTGAAAGAGTGDPGGR